MSHPDDEFDLDEILRAAGRATGISEQLRQGEVIVGTAGHVLDDQVQADVQAGRDIVDGHVRAAHDVVNGITQAGGDYTGGWSRAADDAAHGNVLAVPVDLISGQVKATAHLVEGGLNGVKDLAVGEFKAAGHLIEGGEKVAHDLVQGAADLVGLNSDDKAGTLKKVGAEDPELLKANAAEQQRGRARLQDIKRTLAQKNPRSFATADELLDPGSAGMHVFDYFLPAYNAWTGRHVTIQQIRDAYDRERGMSFRALMDDADRLGATGERVQELVATLQRAYNALVPNWQGQAAQQFETTMATYFQACASVSSGYADAAKGLSSVVVALQQLVYTKASAVSQLYAETLPPGIDGVQAEHSLVRVARNDRPDPVRRWVLGTFHQPMHGRHMTDDDNDMWSTSALDDRSRQLAQQVATQWCDGVLAEQIGRRIELFFEICDRTTQGIEQLFASLTKSMQAVRDPFASMPLTQPVDAPPATTTPQGAAPGGGGYGGPAGGGGYGGPAGGGGYGGPSGGWPAGSGGPSGGWPAGNGGPTTTVPTTTVPAPVTSPTVPSPAAPVTNADGSVTFGQSGDLKVGPENPDGSFDLVQTGPGGSHEYRVVFGPNGRPVVTAVDGSPVTPASGIHTQADGSITVGSAGLSVGPDDAGAGFTITQGDSGAQHQFQVSYDDTGHPHVADLGAAMTGPTGVTAPTAITPPPGVPADGGSSGVAVGPHVAATSTAHGATTGLAATGAGGGAVGGTVTGSGATAAPSTPVQAGVGTTYGALAADSGASMPAAGPAAAAAAGSAHGGAMGMPMMPMGGMGRGGGEQDIKRRYQPEREGVVDDADLEEWDRLGPTIG